MIDWSAPIELDNGTPARLIKNKPKGFYYVEIQGNYLRKGTYEGSRGWNYYPDGVWVGGSAEDMYTIRNVVIDASEMEYDF